MSPKQVVNGHFTLLINLFPSQNTSYTHKHQGINYLGYLHVLKYLLIFIIIKLIEKGVLQRSRFTEV